MAPDFHGYTKTCLQIGLVILLFRLVATKRFYKWSLNRSGVNIKTKSKLLPPLWLLLLFSKILQRTRFATTLKYLNKSDINGRYFWWHKKLHISRIRVNKEIIQNKWQLTARLGIYEGNFTKIKYLAIITIDVTILLLLIFRELNGRKSILGSKVNH